jgi:hypothetical protein
MDQRIERKEVLLVRFVGYDRRRGRVRDKRGTGFGSALSETSRKPAMMNQTSRCLTGVVRGDETGGCARKTSIHRYQYRLGKTKHKAPGLRCFPLQVVTSAPVVFVDGSAVRFCFNAQIPVMGEGDAVQPRSPMTT